MNLPERLATARRTKIAVACGLLMALPACQIPGPRSADPGHNLPASFPVGPAGTNPADNSAQLGVDQFYNDPTLTALIAQAVNGNRELRALSEEVEIASAEILSRQGARLPIATFGGGVGLEKPSRYTREGAVEEQLEILPGKRFPNPLWNFSLGAIDFSVPLDIWGQLRMAREAAEQRYLAAVERRNDFQTRLVADVADHYFRLMALDRRLENLDKTIALQEQSLEAAKAKKAAGRGTELAVQRFQAEVRRNQSEKSVVRQEQVEVENRINFLAGRFPQTVDRSSATFLDLTPPVLNVGVPAQLLQNRPDIRQAEREMAAAGLEVEVARTRFYPNVNITAGIGYQAFNPKYLLNTPAALAYDLAGNLTAPLINTAAIQADYQTANARQLQAVYNYQRVVLNAFAEVATRLAMVENFTKSIDLKRQQLTALELSVEAANQLFQAARAEYIEVLFAQRELMEARMNLIDLKRQQLSAVVNAYQALGGGLAPPKPAEVKPAAVLPPPAK